MQLGVAADRVHICSPGAPPWAGGVVERRAAARGTRILFVGTLSTTEERRHAARRLRAVAIAVPNAPPLTLAGHTTRRIGTVGSAC